MADDLLDSLSPSERLFLGVLLGRLQSCAPMILGIYAEAVVALALPGATHVKAGTDRTDLRWTDGGRELAIEVKCTSGTVWSVGPSYAREGGERVRRRRADVYVLARHEGAD
ncbi:MAG: hypothetical protein KF703_19450, partial [Actinobacteria bacterium]|nr:hypothetical protein [Actinomycetota bacterium]